MNVTRRERQSARIDIANPVDARVPGATYTPDHGALGNTSRATELSAQVAVVKRVLLAFDSDAKKRVQTEAFGLICILKVTIADRDKVCSRRRIDVNSVVQLAWSSLSKVLRPLRMPSQRTRGAVQATKLSRIGRRSNSTLRWMQQRPEQRISSSPSTEYEWSCYICRRKGQDLVIKYWH